MKLLITGGLGYIGGRLVDYLHQQPGYELRLLVRRKPPAFTARWSGVEFWSGDLTEPATLSGIGEGVTQVIHLVALNHTVCVQDPIAALRVNVEGTLNLLAAVGSDIQQFIKMSTIHVYGANNQGQVTEATPIAPIHPYAVTHAMSELYVSMYARRYEYGASIIRLSNSYGAPFSVDVKQWTVVVNDLCRQAVTQKRLVLRSAGLQVRDFIGLADVIQATKLLLQQPSKTVMSYNLGGATYTILEVAKMVQQVYAALYGALLPLERPDPQPGETPGQLDFQCQPMQTLGFVRTINLEQGIRETLQFCQTAFGDSS